MSSKRLLLHRRREDRNKDGEGCSQDILARLLEELAICREDPTFECGFLFPDMKDRIQRAMLQDHHRSWPEK